MNYLDYRMLTKDRRGKTLLIQSGYVSDKGTIVFVVPDDVPSGGMIILEWEPRPEDEEQANG